jgi:L-fuculose-phosphate aldolase
MEEVTLAEIPEQIARERICKFGRKLLDKGLTKGTGGNISYRLSEDEMLITPSGLPYPELGPGDICKVNYRGEELECEGNTPSSETPMHSHVYRKKERVKAIMHTHSPYASTLATAGKSIPPIYYQIAFVGDKVPVARYRTYGTLELGKSAVEALGDGNGVLLERHGVLAVERDLESVFEVASIIEELARIYYQTLAANITPSDLGEDEIDRLKKRFQNYGQKEKSRD